MNYSHRPDEEEEINDPSNTVTQLINKRNTNCVSLNNRQARRAWGFTLNNYTSQEIDTLTQRKFVFQKNNVEIIKYLFQVEVGEKKGIRHLQGCLYFKNAVSFACIKTLLPRAHIDPAKKNWHALLNYCSKSETRDGKIYRYGCLENRKKVSESREDRLLRWEKHIEMCKEEFGKSLLEDIKYLCLEFGHADNCDCRKK